MTTSIEAERDLLDALGGTGTVAEALGITNTSRVSNWRQRGVPLRYRNKIARLARKKRVSLPAGFLEPLEELAA